MHSEDWKRFKINLTKQRLTPDLVEILKDEINQVVNLMAKEKAETLYNAQGKLQFLLTFVLALERDEGV